MSEQVRKNYDNLDEYQAINSKRNKTYPSIMEALKDGALGLNGEAGEVADIVKKYTYHGHDLDKEHLKEELGDTLWYISALATAIDVPLSEIATQNVEKLHKRYPEGFDASKSVNRRILKGVPRLIIIEGFDGSGKTTLSMSLMAKTSSDYVKNNYEGSIDNNVKRAIEVLETTVEVKAPITIFDRFHGISDIVLDIEHKYSIQHNFINATLAYIQTRHLDVDVIWLQKSKELILKEFAARDAMAPLESVLIDNFDVCYKNAKRALQIYRDAGIPVHVIDVDNQLPEDTLAQVISKLQLEEKNTCK